MRTTSGQILGNPKFAGTVLSLRDQVVRTPVCFLLLVIQDLRLGLRGLQARDSQGKNNC
jgi:hypothetical protein